MQVFLRRGLAATSLDELSAAMGINRPSLYNAFGDKEAVYRQAFARFSAQMRAQLQQVFGAEPELPRALANFYAAGLDVYFNKRPATGCFVFCTAPVETMTHAEIRRDVRKILREVDALLAARFELAQTAGTLSLAIAPAELARNAQAVLHSLALRARAGESRAALDRMAAAAVILLCRS